MNEYIVFEILYAGRLTHELNEAAQQGYHIVAAVPNPGNSIVIMEREITEKRTTRWHTEMRAWEDSMDLPAHPQRIGPMLYERRLCWAYVDADNVCIRDRGHDYDVHEPV